MPARFSILLLGYVAAAAGDPCRDGAQALERRDLAAAETALLECVRAPAAPVEAHLLLCGVYQAQGKADALEAAAYAGLKRFPAEKRFYLTVGTYAGRAARFTRAIEVLEAGYSRWPDDSPMKSLLESAHVGRGKELLDAGDNEGAVKHLRRAAILVPDDAEAQLNLGRALHNLHRGLDALAAFDHVLKLDARFPLARFHRGMTLNALGEFDRAIADLDEEIAANPNYAPARLVRGLARMSKGDWEQALADLDIAAAQMPHDAKAQYARARALAQLGKTAEAEAGFRKTIELDADDPAPLNALVRLLAQNGRSAEAAPLAARAAELARRQRSAAPGEVRYQRGPHTPQ
jgi:tetratricopeptide (TPR) repeat protein